MYNMRKFEIELIEYIVLFYVEVETDVDEAKIVFKRIIHLARSVFLMRLYN